MRNPSHIYKTWTKEEMDKISAIHQRYMYIKIVSHETTQRKSDSHTSSTQSPKAMIEKYKWRMRNPSIYKTWTKEEMDKISAIYQQDMYVNIASHETIQRKSDSPLYRGSIHLLHKVKSIVPCFAILTTLIYTINPNWAK